MSTFSSFFSPPPFFPFVWGSVFGVVDSLGVWVSADQNILDGNMISSIKRINTKRSIRRNISRMRK